MGSQSFYPREGWVSMWCLIFLMLRVWVQRQRVLHAPLAVESVRRPAFGPRVLQPAGRSLSPTTAVQATASSSRRPLRRLPVFIEEKPVISEEALWAAGPKIQPEPSLHRSVRPGVRRAG
jgi:hypothetical protein